MIFVAVGTHEQPFNRLVSEVDLLVGSGFIQEEVFIQRGMKAIVPKNCPSSEMLSYSDMIEKINKARIVITHGGPGSIMISISLGKIPIVVPRRRCFGEHVDDHQVGFIRRLETQYKVIAVYEIKEMWQAIKNYEVFCQKRDCNMVSKVRFEQLISNLDNYCQRSLQKAT